MMIINFLMKYFKKMFSLFSRSQKVEFELVSENNKLLFLLGGKSSSFSIRNNKKKEYFIYSIIIEYINCLNIKRWELIYNIINDFNNHNNTNPNGQWNDSMACRSNWCLSTS